MDYLENESWRPYYQELDEEKRWKLYEEIVNSTEDDGANALRKKLYEKRYTNPKKPGKKTDNGIWEMVVMPAQFHGVVAMKKNTQKQIRESLEKLGITEENMSTDVKKSAVYWEIRNIARRFYSTMESPRYGRKLFGMMESSWDEKQVRAAGDVWTMAELVPEKFDMKEEMELFTRAVIDEFYCVSDDAKRIYEAVREKSRIPRFPIIL